MRETRRGIFDMESFRWSPGMISTGRLGYDPDCHALFSLDGLEHFPTIPVPLDLEALSRTAKEASVVPLIDDLGKQ